MRTLRPMPRGQLGFTLLEVVLALTIFALMGTILYGAFSLGHNAVARSSHAFEKNQALRSFGDLLGSYVRSSYPYRVSLRDPSIFYEGEEDQLTFVSSFSLAMGGRGMAKIHLSWDGTEQGGGPLRLEEVVPVRLGEEAVEEGLHNSLVLEKGVREFRLAYLDPTSAEEIWEEEWDAKEKRMLPRAVRLSYRDAAGKNVRWVFPVMISVLAP
jgi:prepilin-type N-terminal cleavage/methylation domain-containing protein